MKTPVKLLATAALLLSPLLSAPAGAQDLGAARSEIAHRCDAAVHGLRAQQDLETGSYGSVRATAWVLRALAAVPRHYRPGDGPFFDEALASLVGAQRADGAICAADASEREAVDSTTWVLAALTSAQVAAQVEDSVLAGAVRFLGASTLPAPPAAVPPPATAEACLDRAHALMARLDDEAALEASPRGRVEETARILVELAGLHDALGRLASAAGRSAGTRTTTPLPAFDAADRARALAALERGALFLVGAADANGLWGAPDRPDAGITAMVLGALEELPAPRPEPVQAAIDRGLDWLLSLQHEDGSIHQGQLANYVTSASILALAAADRPGDREAIARARTWLKSLQADEGEGYGEHDRFYGGVGYGDDERPDLSNLQMALEALSAAGLDPGDEAFTKALRFLERTQNRSESNDVRIEEAGGTIVSGNDGGAVYAPGDSKAGFIDLPDGTRVPRSYGSMTYALLKGYLFAGLPRDDPRVQAAWTWCSEHWTLDVNPGFEASSDPTAAYQGLFYYFTTMARALDLYGAEQVTDAAGRAHAWRQELCGRLVSMQRQDGSWRNENSPRWWEGNPVLASAYALLTLGTALPGASGSD